MIWNDENGKTSLTGAILIFAAVVFFVVAMVKAGIF